MNPLKLFSRRWLLGLLVALFLGVGSLVVASGGTYYLLVYLPWEYYNALNLPPWQSLNVQTMAFTSLQDFKIAEKKLQAKLPEAEKNSDPVPTFLLASLYQTMDRKAQALHYYQQTIQTITHQPTALQEWMASLLYHYFLEDAHASLAVLYYQTHQPQRAMVHIEAVEDLAESPQKPLLIAIQHAIEEPERGDSHFLLGLAFRHHLQLPDAQHEFRQAIALSQDPQLKTEAQRYLAMKMPHLKKNLSPLAIYYSLAGDTYSEAQHDYAQAASFYEKAIQEAPGFEWPYYQLAVVHHHLKNNRRVEEYIHKALSLNPNFALPYVTLGDLALDEENYPKAIEHFTKARKLALLFTGEEDRVLIANIDNQLGYAYEQLQNKAKALAHYRNVLEVSEESSADYTYAETALARMQANLDQQISAASNPTEL